jgi:hypothetical protein
LSTRARKCSNPARLYIWRLIPRTEASGGRALPLAAASLGGSACASWWRGPAPPSNGHRPRCATRATWRFSSDQSIWPDENAPAQQDLTNANLRVQWAPCLRTARPRRELSGGDRPLPFPTTRMQNAGIIRPSLRRCFDCRRQRLDAAVRFLRCLCGGFGGTACLYTRQDKLAISRSSPEAERRPTPTPPPARSPPRHQDRLWLARSEWSAPASSWTGSSPLAGDSTP